MRQCIYFGQLCDFGGKLRSYYLHIAAIGWPVEASIDLTERTHVPFEQISRTSLALHKLLLAFSAAGNRLSHRGDLQFSRRPVDSKGDARINVIAVVVVATGA